MIGHRIPRTPILVAISCLALGFAATPALGSGQQSSGALASTGPAARVPDLHLVGSATRTSGGRILLVTKSSTAGAAYTPAPVDVSSFTLKMVFSIVGGCADGLALVVQNEGIDALGGEGGLLGYSRGKPEGKNVPGITHSIAVELDTWQNPWDPAVPHVSLQSRARWQNDADTTYSLINKPVSAVADGQEHRITIHYRDGILHVWYGGERLINNRIDLAKHLGLTDGTAFVGVTAANGSCQAKTTIDDFTLTS